MAKLIVLTVQVESEEDAEYLKGKLEACIVEAEFHLGIVLEDDTKLTVTDKKYLLGDLEAGDLS